MCCWLAGWSRPLVIAESGQAGSSRQADCIETRRDESQRDSAWLAPKPWALELELELELAHCGLMFAVPQENGEPSAVRGWRLALKLAVRVCRWNGGQRHGILHFHSCLLSDLRNPHAGLALRTPAPAILLVI